MTDEQLTISTLIAKATSLRRNERPGEAYLLEKTAETLARVTTDRDRLREALEKMLDPQKTGVITYEIGMMQDIARAALREAG